MTGSKISQRYQITEKLYLYHTTFNQSTEKQIIIKTKKKSEHTIFPERDDSQILQKTE